MAIYTYRDMKYKAEPGVFEFDGGGSEEGVKGEEVRVE